MLDMGTGGGERLARLPSRPPRTVATEAWPPNVPVAAARLRPLGIPVIQDEGAPDNKVQDNADAGRLPFRDGAFALVASRHEAFRAREVSRVLAPGGAFVTQHIDYHSSDDLYRLLGLAAPKQPESWLPLARQQVRDAGLIVQAAVRGEERHQLRDVGALVYYLRVVSWAVPEYSLDRCRTALRAAHETPELWPAPFRQRLFPADRDQARGLQVALSHGGVRCQERDRRAEQLADIPTCPIGITLYTELVDRQGQPDGRGLVVAIIGGGASGTLTAVHLLRNAADSGLDLRVALIDEHGRHGGGVAYSTGHDGHLLNVVACQMSAFPADPGHLVRWANTAGRGTVPGGHAVTDTMFRPRAAYGRYLRDVLTEAERHAWPAGQLSRFTAQAVAVRRNNTGRAVRVVLADGHLDADVAVLATGSTPAALPIDAPATSRVITDPWHPDALAGLAGCAGAHSVVILGSGLTMLDLAVAVTAANPDVVVHAVSRHGLLPRTHPGTPPRPGRPIWLPVISRTTEPVRLTELTWQVRAALRANPANWHHVVCSLRPFVPGLWRRMPDADKRVFLRHLARYWEIHRHLAPPQTARRIAELRVGGQLVIHRGRIRAVTSDAGQLRFLLDSGDDTIELQADWLINGTGATADITANPSSLLRQLFRAGLARPDPLRLGIDATVHGALVEASGAPSDVLYTLGPPLRGLWYETTAIPEIREQAAALARLIVGGRLAQRRPGSAA
jgi:uncharacterized NAD(P)/FAD-binding protein YdhS/SAM-dependent methyltransferase